MPILPIIYIVTAVTLFGSGYFYGWKGEHDEVIALEQQLNTINAQSAKLLNETKAHNAELTAAQLIANAEIEKKYNEQIKTNDSLHDQLIDAMRVRRSASATRDCNTVPKADNTSRGQENNVRGFDATVDAARFSERFDTFVSRKALQADKIDAERRLLLDWVKTIPPEMIK